MNGVKWRWSPTLHRQRRSLTPLNPFVQFPAGTAIFTDEFRDAPEGRKTYNLLVRKLVAGIDSPDEIEAILRPIAAACPPEFLKSKG